MLVLLDICVFRWHFRVRCGGEELGGFRTQGRCLGFGFVQEGSERIEVLEERGLRCLKVEFCWMKCVHLGVLI